MDSKRVKVSNALEIELRELGVPKHLVGPMVIFHGKQASRYAHEHNECHLNDVESCLLCIEKELEE